MPWHGLVTYTAMIMAFVQEVMAYLVDFTTMPAVMFNQDAAGSVGGFPMPSSGQFHLNLVNLPELTPKGEDIVASIMTIVHNGIVAVAQLSTLLPYNSL